MKRKSSFGPRFFLALLALGLLPCLTVQVPGEDFVAGYHVDGRYLLLGEAMETTSGTLKPFETMTPGEIATIYHEMWHAWFIHVETPRQGPVFTALSEWADHADPSIPEEKQLEVVEEAAADFIDAVIQTTVQMKRFLSTKTPERREEIRRKTQYLDRYGYLFEEEYTGYFTKSVGEKTESPQSPGLVDSAIQAAQAWMRESVTSDTMAAIAEAALPPQEAVAEFVQSADDFGLPVDYLKEAAEAMAGVVFIRPASVGVSLGGGGGFQANVVWSYVPLPGDLIELLTRELFDKRLSPDSKKTFAEERFGKSEGVKAF